MRKRLLGKLDRRALDGPSPEIPDAFDWTYFQAAPLDQQIDDFAPGDMIVLIGMHPDLPTLRTLVPSRRAVAVAESRRGRRAKIPLRLDTLFLEPLALRAELVFRGAVEVQLEDLPGLRVAGAAEEPSVPFRFPDFAMLERSGGAEPPPEPPRRARESTVILEAPAPATAAPRAGAASPADVARSGTMVIEPPKTTTAPMRPEMPERRSPDLADAPPTPASRRGRKRREATIELSLEPSPRSTPFDKKPRRSRSSSTMPAVAPGPSWAELRASAPVVAPADPPKPGAKTAIPDLEPAPPSERAPRSKRRISSSSMRAADAATKEPARPGAAANEPPPVEKKSRDEVRWAEVPEASPAARPAAPVARAPMPPVPDRKGQLYKKFKPK
jgi:hypothetical protein